MPLVHPLEMDLWAEEDKAGHGSHYQIVVRTSDLTKTGVTAEFLTGQHGPGDNSPGNQESDRQTDERQEPQNHTGRQGHIMKNRKSAKHKQRNQIEDRNSHTVQRRHGAAALRTSVSSFWIWDLFICSLFAPRHFLFLLGTPIFLPTVQKPSR